MPTKRSKMLRVGGVPLQVDMHRREVRPPSVKKDEDTRSLRAWGTVRMWREHHGTRRH